MENNNWWWRKLEAVLARARARMDEANEVAWRDCLEAEVKKGYRSEFSIDLDFLSLSCRATEARRRRSVVACFSSFPSLFITFPLSFLQPLFITGIRAGLSCLYLDSGAYDSYVESGVEVWLPGGSSTSSSSSRQPGSGTSAGMALVLAPPSFDEIGGSSSSSFSGGDRAAI